MTKSRTNHVFSPAIGTSLYRPLTAGRSRIARQRLRYGRRPPKFLLRIIDYFSHKIKRSAYKVHGNSTAKYCAT
jgi:hypothetical protein